MFSDRIEFLPGLIIDQDTEVVPVVRETSEFIHTLCELTWQNCLELGTGTGALALALSSRGRVMGTDINTRALELSRHNQQQNGLDCEWLLSDWFEQVQGRWDLILAHPPHERDSVYALADHRLRARITAEMICGGPDGLAHCERILDQAQNYLSEQGYLAMIIDDQRSQDLILLADQWQAQTYHRSGECALWIFQARRGRKFFSEGAAQNF